MNAPTWKRCGHPRTPENTAKVTQRHPGGQCRECVNAWRREWNGTPAGREWSRRHNDTQAITGKRREMNARRVADGRAAISMREYRNREKERLALLDAPNLRSFVQEASRVVVLSDLQIPFEDEGAVNAALQVIRSVSPDTLVLAGDIVDCYQESSFLKNTDKAKIAVEEEHERVNDFLTTPTVAGIPKKYWLGGNHEDRWRRLLWSKSHEAKDFLAAHQKASGVPVDLVDPVKLFVEQFHLEEHGVAYFPYGHRLYFAEGNLVVTHGKYISRHSGYSAKRTFEWLGKSCIVGHTHRQGTYRVSQDGKEHGAWENGCLCQLEPEFDDTPNWQQGFSVVKVDGPEFHVVQIPIVRRNGRPVAVHSL